MVRGCLGALSQTLAKDQRPALWGHKTGGGGGGLSGTSRGYKTQHMWYLSSPAAVFLQQC
ncbi:hypothetical protein NQZ68_031030 [Dissostichus eleginoides]|nr:hypothetical protein NQZ68_031030 [Dissostichus eleginoides]